MKTMKSQVSYWKHIEALQTQCKTFLVLGKLEFSISGSDDKQEVWTFHECMDALKKVLANAPVG